MFFSRYLFSWKSQCLLCHCLYSLTHVHGLFIISESEKQVIYISYRWFWCHKGWLSKHVKRRFLSWNKLSKRGCIVGKGKKCLRCWLGRKKVKWLLGYRCMLEEQENVRQNNHYVNNLFWSEYFLGENHQSTRYQFFKDPKNTQVTNRPIRVAMRNPQINLKHQNKTEVRCFCQYFRFVTID